MNYCNVPLAIVVNRALEILLWWWWWWWWWWLVICRCVLPASTRSPIL